MNTDSLDTEIEQLNTARTRSVPGSAIQSRFEDAHQHLDDANPLVEAKFHAGREFYVNEANREVYEALMGKKPVEVNGRVYSELAIQEGMKCIRDSSDECLTQYREARDNHQDLIDEKLSELKIFDVPTTPQELEKELERLAHKSGVSLKGLKAIKKAQQADAVMKVFELVGIKPRSIESVESSQDYQHKLNTLVQRGGRGKIQAALMTKQ
ncbi:TPA: hypothetical protein KDY13_003829 [Vibrio parahaemolyticus]|nr:hypothetical protein [Vibrio parahaemolyticus]